jgi:periplasmic protein TonB
MTAAAERFPRLAVRPGEVWLTVSLSLLVHALILVTVFLVPRFRIGTYLTVPVTYSVSLESGPSAARRGGGAAPAPAVSAPVPPAPAPPAPAARSAPAPRAAPPSDELMLPGRQPAKKTPPIEPSLRPTPLVGRETPPPRATPEAPPAVAAPIAPAPPVALPALAPAPGPVPGGAGPGKGGGLELAGKEGTGPGGTALGYYLSLVDYKINTNWTPVGGGKTNMVMVRFRVLRSGQVRDIELESSSGLASLDAAALRAIRQSVPLPPFPNLLTEPQLELRYRFVME